MVNELVFCRVIGVLAIGLFLYRTLKRGKFLMETGTLYMILLIIILGVVVIETILK